VSITILTQNHDDTLSPIEHHAVIAVKLLPVSELQYRAIAPH